MYIPVGTRSKTVPIFRRKFNRPFKELGAGVERVDPDTPLRVKSTAHPYAVIWNAVQMFRDRPLDILSEYNRALMVFSRSIVDGWMLKTGKSTGGNPARKRKRGSNDEGEEDAQDDSGGVDEGNDGDDHDEAKDKDEKENNNRSDNKDHHYNTENKNGNVDSAANFNHLKVHRRPYDVPTLVSFCNDGMSSSDSDDSDSSEDGRTLETEDAEEKDRPFKLMPMEGIESIISGWQKSTETAMTPDIEDLNGHDAFMGVDEKVAAPPSGNWAKWRPEYMEHALGERKVRRLVKRKIAANDD